MNMLTLGLCRGSAGTLPGLCRDSAETLPGLCRQKAGTLPSLSRLCRQKGGTLPRLSRLCRDSAGTWEVLPRHIGEALSMAHLGGAAQGAVELRTALSGFVKHIC